MRLTAKSILPVLALLALGCASDADSPSAKESSSANDPEPASAQRSENLHPSTPVISPTAAAKPVPERVTTAPSPGLPTIDADGSRFTVKGGSSSQAFNRHIERGGRLFNTRKLADAAKEFEAAVAADPQDARGYYYLGLAELELGKASKSIRHFDMALNRAPKHIDSFWPGPLPTCAKSDFARPKTIVMLSLIRMRRTRGRLHFEQPVTFIWGSST
jgi:tetratricopeptide (TPR) repeat protein